MQGIVCVGLETLPGVEVILKYPPLPPERASRKLANLFRQRGIFATILSTRELVRANWFRASSLGNVGRFCTAAIVPVVVPGMAVGFEIAASAPMLTCFVLHMLVYVVLDKFPDAGDRSALGSKQNCTTPFAAATSRAYIHFHSGTLLLMSANLSQGKYSRWQALVSNK